MRIKISFYGITKDIVKKQSLYLSFHNDTKLSDLKNKLFDIYKDLKKINLKFAINDEIVWDGKLKEGDEISLLPPVSGGRGVGEKGKDLK